LLSTSHPRDKIWIWVIWYQSQIGLAIF
jgi:hypothetical protein